MRVLATQDALTVKAYSGTTNVLLAMSLGKAARKNLLGFAIEREDAKDKRFLNGLLAFPGQKHNPGEPTGSDTHPIQKFHWGDYTAYAGTKYTYRVHPVYGTPAKLKLGPPAELKIETHALGADQKHSVIFNRAAASSQAFMRHFPDVNLKPSTPPEKVPQEVKDWLTRGLLQEMLNLMERAKDKHWALDIAIYEYELPEIIDAVNAVQDRGVNLRIIFHAKVKDPQTAENKANLKPIDAASKFARVTSKIFHDKFIVLSKLKGDARTPQAVLCGSTNFTLNGVFFQANVLHVANDPGLAKCYLDHFEAIWDNKETVAATKKRLTSTNLMPAVGDGAFCGFSPRSGEGDLDFFASLIGAAERDVLFTTAFSMSPKIYAALMGKKNDSILRYGLQNSGNKIKGVHKDRNADFVESALLSKGIEGFIKEQLRQKGNILVHTKVILVDFTSDSPIIMSGSHNYSKPASDGNDENYLVMQGPEFRDVADIYGTEVMRIYDHYRFRFKRRTSGSKKGIFLCPDDSWTDEYYAAGNLKQIDRLRFAGA